jgi:hypothetical protein
VIPASGSNHEHDQPLRRRRGEATRRHTAADCRVEVGLDQGLDGRWCIEDPDLDS